MKHTSRPAQITYIRPSYETHKQASCSEKTEMLLGNRSPRACCHMHPQNRSAVFLEDSQEPTDQPLKLIKELSKLTNYIISIENYNLTLNQKISEIRTHWYYWPPLWEPKNKLRKTQTFMKKGWAANIKRQPKTGGMHTAVERHMDALNTSPRSWINFSVQNNLNPKLQKDLTQRRRWQFRGNFKIRSRLENWREIGFIKREGEIFALPSNKSRE